MGGVEFGATDQAYCLVSTPGMGVTISVTSVTEHERWFRDPGGTGNGISTYEHFILFDGDSYLLTFTATSSSKWLKFS